MTNATKLFEKEQDIVMHIAVLMSIAMADGQFLDVEKKFIEELAASYAAAYGTRTFDQMTDCLDGLPKSAMTEWEQSIISKPVVVRTLLKDMIALGHVDGDFCKEERNLVDDYAKRYNVPKEVVDAIDGVVTEMCALTERLNGIITG